MQTVARYGLSKSSLAGPLLGILQPFLLYHIVNSIVLPLFGMDGDTSDGRCTAVCSAWGNTSVVPLIFVESLFRNQPEYLAKSYANISLFLVGWSPFFWSFGRTALLGKQATASTGTNQEEEANGFQLSQLLSKVKPLFPPPVMGVTIGLALALFQPIRNLFMGGPLQTIFNSVSTFGRAASPLSLLVLTSSLALNIGIRPKSQPKEEAVPTQDLTTNGTSEGKNKTSFMKRWMCVSLSRFLLSPLLVVGLLKSFQVIGIISPPQQDPLLWFLSILQGCMPSAQNPVLMFQVSNQLKQAGAIAKFLFFVYATSMLPVVLIVSMALQRFGLA